MNKYLLFTQTNTDCIDCHSDNELTFERNGKKISFLVDSDTYSFSIHGELSTLDDNNFKIITEEFFQR